MKHLALLLLPFFLHAQSIELQILGSGGPELSKRASSSYIIWIDGKSKALIDAGGGAFTRFAKAEAKIEDLDFIALSHLHIDHAADLPAFMKAGYFSKRTNALPILGTVGAGDFPDIKLYLERLFGTQGAYAYMNDILTKQSDSFQIVPQLFDQGYNSANYGDIIVGMAGVKHAQIPALAYCLSIGDKKIVFAGDTSAQSEKLINLSHKADYLIVHHAIPQHAGEYAKELHITPKRIGEVAAKAQVKNLILSHRMKRTYDSEEESLKLIRENYKGNVIWAEDLMKIKVK
ncbi:MAG TPA: MBL fold metallo-hydrolase [Campylobacterales bacterium]|nr:MBL fold metallo-hydrolase [Campylobacterales bacterium]